MHQAQDDDVSVIDVATVVENNRISRRGKRRAALEADEDHLVLESTPEKKRKYRYGKLPP